MIMNPILWLRALITTIAPDETPPDLEHADPDAKPDPFPDILRVGAWTGSSSLATDKAVSRDVKFAIGLGLGRLDIMVNDHSKARSARPFDTHKKPRILALGRAARGAGLEVHLTSWIMPHERYIREAADQLLELADSIGASSLMFDAEEPWTQAKGSFNYEEASVAIAEGFARVPWGVTGIGYTPVAKLGPLVRRAAYMTPQCYSTTSSGLDPATACTKLVNRWRDAFGHDHGLVVGLAAYRQSGIKGYSTADAVRTAFRTARANSPSDIVYWSLSHLRSNATVAATLRKMIQEQS